MAGRRLPFSASRQIAIAPTNRSAGYARAWLDLLTGGVGAGAPAPRVAIVGGDEDAPDGAECVIRAWDFQVGRPGTGAMACAASGASAVIGSRGGSPLSLPADMPEKWCGAFALVLALAELWRRRGRVDRAPIAYDVSAADVLRAFCLQNAGDADETRRRWRRNGRLCIEHGGIFPMGFFPCRGGHVAVLGRSRRDWRQIREALGNPPWASAPEFENPFELALDGARADELLGETLRAFDRDELLRRGLRHGAVLAPLYTQAEAAARGVFRAGFVDDDARPAMPFLVESMGVGVPSTRVAGEGGAYAPLAGLRCLELAWVWSGPMVGQILADLGAETIKIESAGRFDLYRTRGLETLRGKMDESIRLESSLYFHSLNRNKRGLTVDLKHPRGLALAKALVGASDVLIENFTVGTMERMGLDRAALAGANPALVHLSMSGPGRGSAVEDLRSYGLVLSALGGAEILIEDGGELMGSPTFSISDPNAAAFGALAALAAALSAQETGRGGAVDLSQIESAATLAGTPTPRPAPSARLDSIRELWETDDAPEFADCPGWAESIHPVTGAERLVAAPWRVAGRRPPVRRPAPMLGGDDVETLRAALGLPTAEIEEMIADRAIGPDAGRAPR